MPLYRVLFVCIGNACRSQMAEAFARRHAADVIEPASCGLAPCEMVAPATQELMLEKGIDLSGCQPKGMEEAGPGFDLVVNMSGMRMPGDVKTPVLEWPVIDPYWLDDDSHREIRDQIEGLVAGLADRLRRGEQP